MANQLRVTLISTELAYIVFAVSIFCSTRINKRRSFERRFLWMSVRVGRLEGLAKEASDVRFRAFKEACARLIAVLPRILDSAIHVRANARFAVCAIGFIMKMAIAW